MGIDFFFSIEPLSWLSIGCAIFCGFIVGLERQLRGKPVGIRTSSLIVLGTYIFIALSMHVTNDTTDPSRIIGQVVTGIGFLGAGVMLAREGTVVGVTSAATIWVLAAIGTSVAIAGEKIAINLSIVLVIILYGIDLLEDYSVFFTRGVHNKIKHWKKRK